LSAAPSAEEVSAAVIAFFSALAERRVDDLARLAPADGDGASARDFAAWMLKADRLRITSVVSDSATTVAGARATLEFRVWVRWSRTLRRDTPKSARFRLTLARDSGAWRGESVQLLERFRAP
jgi:hypothetical protein